MKKLLLLLLVSCGSPTITANDAGPSDSKTDSHIALCCHITQNLVDASLWNNRTYYCPNPDADLDPFNPPWLCGVSPQGECGSNSDFDCKSCNHQDCAVGMHCFGVNGTGDVIPCE